MSHTSNAHSTPTTCRLTPDEYAKLSKMAELFSSSFSDVLRAGLAKMWAEYGDAAEELAQTHERIKQQLSR